MIRWKVVEKSPERTAAVKEFHCVTGMTTGLPFWQALRPSASDSNYFLYFCLGFVIADEAGLEGIPR